PLKADHEAQNKAQEFASLQPQPAEKVAGPQLDVQTQRQKVRQAQVWLKKLDKNSDEGYWFDQFAFKYSSRIDAAIDYLQAVNEFD
ncbi:salt stress protein, Slr1339 family, partial [Microcoleus sp. Pol14C4]